MSKGNTTQDWIKIATGITILLMWVVTNLLVLLHPALRNDPAAMQILAVVNGAMTFLIGYYFGSSKSSQDKTDILSKNKDDAGAGQ